MSHVPVCPYTKQGHPEMINWPVVHSGLEAFWLSSAVHADAHFLLFYTSFKSIYFSHATADLLNQSFKFITTSFPLLPSLHLHSVFLQVFQVCLKIFCQTLI